MSGPAAISMEESHKPGVNGDIFLTVGKSQGQFGYGSSLKGTCRSPGAAISPPGPRLLLAELDLGMAERCSGGRAALAALLGRGLPTQMVPRNGRQASR